MKKKTLLSLLLRCGICLVLAVVCLLIRRGLSRQLPGQRVAERWAGDGETPFSQYSCFLNASDGLTLDSIYAFREKTDQKLAEAEITVPYLDTWSHVGSVTVSSERSSISAAAVAVGGSYFDFHPLNLLSGCYLQQNDLNTDLVVLDEDLAWLLYGSSDLQGMEVSIGGKPFVIAGVVAREDDAATKQYQADSPVIYLSWTAWQELGDTAITCYEAVLPEPVNGFAEQLLKDGLSIGNGLLLKNTGRYDLSGSMKLIRSFGTRGAVTSGVALPWWENAARYYEDWCALLLAVTLALLVFPALCAIAGLIFGWLRLRKLLYRGIPVLWRKAGDGLYALSGKLSGKKKKS